MALFSDPVVLNDGTSDRMFSFRAQMPDKKAVIGEWIEPSALIVDESKIIVKHDASSPNVRRRLLQRSSSVLLPDNVTRKPVTVNLTVTYHPSCSEDEISKAMKLTASAVAENTFIGNFLRGLI